MIIAQFKLSARAHHPLGFHTTDLALTQNIPGRWHHAAWLCQDANQTLAGIGGTTNNIAQLPITHINLQDLQPISIGMRLGMNHMGNFKALKPFGWVFNGLKLQPNSGQAIGEFGEAGLGIQMLFEPFLGEFHGANPPARSGWWKAPNP